MAKGKVNIIGIIPNWRVNKTFDAFRVFVYKNDTQTAISPKIHPILKQINNYLKAYKMRKENAEADNHFQALKNRLYQELKSKYGLKTYKILERLDYNTKEFNFEITLDEFEAYKSDHAISKSYRSWIESFWFPFFQSKNCTRPKEFKQWKKQAVIHIKTATTKHNKKYSPYSYSTLVTPLNEYMKFLVEYEYIGEDDLFSLNVKPTLEQRKRGEVKPNRDQSTYTVEDLISIKTKIDSVYRNNLKMKLRAYAMYLGLCTGLRRGNLLGLKAKNLHPDANNPYFEVNDNIVSGWSRGEEGKIIFKNATKTTYGEDIELPMLQPSKEIITEVAQFLKDNVDEEEYILKCYPDTVNKWWKKVSKDCGFRYLFPHGWKHSYATIGVLHLHDWYKGNPYFLQRCCLHRSFRTTEKYINQVSKQFLKNFSDD